MDDWVHSVPVYTSSCTAQFQSKHYNGIPIQVSALTGPDHYSGVGSKRCRTNGGRTWLCCKYILVMQHQDIWVRFFILQCVTVVCQPSRWKGLCGHCFSVSHWRHQQT